MVEYKTLEKTKIRVGTKHIILKVVEMEGPNVSKNNTFLQIQKGDLLGNGKFVCEQNLGVTPGNSGELKQLAKQIDKLADTF